MKTRLPIYLVIFLLLLGSCKKQNDVIQVTNPSDFNRSKETVIIQIEQLNLTSNLFNVVNAETGKIHQHQLLDDNNDGEVDALVFQTDINSNEVKQFYLQKELSADSTNERTFARFVPERTDDFAWENDRVAFRTYGPTAQNMYESGDPKGTLSSGIDCWLKKVDYPVINKWYQGNVIEPGYYHIDHGEGLDNYHVGTSRGCGGTGVLSKEQIYTSKNFDSYKVFTNGPIISKFELSYEPYQVENNSVTERKVVLIELGSNLTKYEVFVDGVDTIIAGLTLQDKSGVVNFNAEAAWVNFHKPHKGEELSTSIVANPEYFAGFAEIDSDIKDKSHALIKLKVIDGKVEFYSGFYWGASNQFSSIADWEDYLTEFAQKKTEPLIVLVK
jgi:hypothetical protein